MVFSSFNNRNLKRLSLPGKLPPEIANLTYLESFDLSRNYISGNIPEEWASMKHLTSLSLTSNRLSGNIPGYLGSFRSLTYLSLEANQFSGTIPSQLGDLVDLKGLLLSSNQLEGTLPKTLAKLNLTNLRITDMSGPESNLPKIPTGGFAKHQFNWCDPISCVEIGFSENAVFAFRRSSSLSIAKLLTKAQGIFRKLKLENLLMDLTFNKLGGEIPPDAKRYDFM
ncbi:hypothetical protein NC651_026735 [Populus alba x Populus x berolinensis]|nr:hypothetical protein NC651_026735 [Populus alba x Populus x berolinensis]